MVLSRWLPGKALAKYNHQSQSSRQIEVVHIDFGPDSEELMRAFRCLEGLQARPACKGPFDYSAVSLDEFFKDS